MAATTLLKLSTYSGVEGYATTSAGNHAGVPSPFGESSLRIRTNAVRTRLLTSATPREVAVIGKEDSQPKPARLWRRIWSLCSTRAYGGGILGSRLAPSPEG